MKQNEMEIVGSVSVELDPETVFILSYQYHTEKDPEDYEGKRNLRKASRYRNLGVVIKKDDLEKEIYERHLLVNRPKPWKWPKDPDWDGDILYMKDASNAGFSNWLRLRLKKLITNWDDWVSLLRGYKKDTNKRSGTFGKYVVFNPNSAWAVDEYETESGEKISLTDREALLRHVGENVWKTNRSGKGGVSPVRPGELPAA